jgi:MFS family permease
MAAPVRRRGRVASGIATSQRHRCTKSGTPAVPETLRAPGPPPAGRRRCAGRKRVFQTALVVFLVGSALAGMARSLDQLIAFRAPCRASAAAG